jgi:hypothetical protein
MSIQCCDMYQVHIFQMVIFRTYLPVHFQRTIHRYYYQGYEFSLLALGCECTRRVSLWGHFLSCLLIFRVPFIHINMSVDGFVYNLVYKTVTHSLPK